MNWLKWQWYRTEGWLESRLSSHRWAWFVSGIGGTVLGVLLTPFKIMFKPAEFCWLDASMYLISVILTLGGFILAIIALRQMVDRPGTIEEVIYKAALMIEDLRKHHEGKGPNSLEILIFCEYPVLGSLSARGTYAYQEFNRVLNGTVDTESPFYLRVVVAENWNPRLRQYAKGLGLSDHLNDAVTDNIVFLKRLAGYIVSGRAIGVKTKAFPKYQAIIAGTRTQEGAFGPIVGIVFFAIESAVNGVGAAPAFSGPVCILSWKTQDVVVLDAISRFAYELCKPPSTPLG